MLNAAEKHSNLHEISPDQSLLYGSVRSHFEHGGRTLGAGRLVPRTRVSGTRRHVRQSRYDAPLGVHPKQVK
jgi:hypothetical protein